VKTLLEACAPRPEILSDTFSPEIFTAAVRPVVDAYEGKAGAFIDGAYTDPVLFFGKATYPTDGMKQVVEGVCRRLRGLGADAIYRLDTAFGGGKTHILIALTHIALGDRDALRSSVGGVVSPDLVPDSTVSLAVVDGSTADIERSEGGRMDRFGRRWRSRSRVANSAHWPPTARAARRPGRNTSTFCSVAAGSA